MTNYHRVLAFVGRSLMSGIFLSSGLDKIRRPSESEQYMAAKHLPLVPVLRPVAAGVELASALSLLLNRNPRVGAAMALGFLVPTTGIFHDFWGVPRGQERDLQLINFLKNLALMGGLLSVIAYESSRKREVRFREVSERKAA